MKILVLHCGGTISCKEINGALTPSLDIEPEFSAIKSQLGSVSFRHRRIKPFLSEYLNGSHITRIAKEVGSALSSGRYGGIIVTHGSDTVAYTSAALGYIFGNACAPIVTVCADLPLSDPHSSGHVNLRAAAALIAYGGVKGVFSVYRENETCATVHRATRLLRHRSYETPLTSSGEPFGRLDLTANKEAMLIRSPLYREKSDGMENLKAELKKISPVIHISVYPGMRYPSLPRGCKAVILGSYHSGTVDTESPELKRFARRCKRAGVPIFVDGTGATADYESMLAYNELGIRRLPPLSSPVAMYMKLWLFAASGVSALTGAIERSLGGDIIPKE